MNPQYWQAVAAFIAACAALYAVVTAPLLRTLKAEISASEARQKVLLTEIKTEMASMEARLNARIDTRLVHR